MRPCRRGGWPSSISGAERSGTKTAAAAGSAAARPTQQCGGVGAAPPPQPVGNYTGAAGRRHTNNRKWGQAAVHASCMVPASHSRCRDGLLGLRVRLAKQLLGPAELAGKIDRPGTSVVILQ